MKVCVTASGGTADAQVDPRFGRAVYFIFLDPDTMAVEAVQNPNVSAVGGAGIQSAQLIVEKGAQVLITGALGPNAAMALQSAGVQVVLGVQGITAREAVEAFKRGELKPAQAQATGPAHMGTGGIFPGMGRGMGRGMGIGRGRMGGFGTMPSSPGFSSKEEEIAALREEMEFIKGRLEYVTKRLQELEKK